MEKGVQNMQVRTVDASYVTDISSKEAWDMLSNNPRSTLIDVRTTAEWAFVGTPDLTSLGKELIQLSYRLFPSMHINPQFSDELSATLEDKTAPLLFICRTGGRSMDAALEMAGLGYTQCYNISDGFEGRMDAQEHRGNSNGWKADNLPWRQM